MQKMVIKSQPLKIVQNISKEQCEICEKPHRIFNVSIDGIDSGIIKYCYYTDNYYKF